MIPGDFNLSGEVRFTILVCSEDTSRATSLLELVFFVIKEHYRCPSTSDHHGSAKPAGLLVG